VDVREKKDIESLIQGARIRPEALPKFIQLLFKFGFVL